MPSVDYSALTLIEIRTTSRQNGFITPRSAPTQKEDLLLSVAQHASPNVVSTLTGLAREKEGSRPSSPRRSRPEEAEAGRPGVRRRLEEFQPVKARHTYDQSKYLDLPTAADEVNASYRHFYEATSNNALKMVVCGVCSRKVGVQDDNVLLPLQDLPNGHCLVSHQQHPVHHLFEGKLSDPAGVQLCDQPAGHSQYLLPMPV